MDIKAILTEVHNSGSPDLHLQVGHPPFLRTKTGDIVAIEKHQPLTKEDVDAVIQEITPKSHLEVFAEKMEADFTYNLEGASRFRVNIYQERFGPAIAFRLIGMTIPTLEEVGLDESIKQLLESPYGLILVTGPTGSGKSTTLASMVDYINQTRRSKIVTIEDPIEFVYQNKGCLVNQRELITHTPSYPEAIRGGLRQDLDVALVGEMRDFETTKAVLTLAETGHLVFSSMHTNNAIQTVDRIIDLFPGDQHPQVRSQLSTSLKAVISQVLVPTADGKQRVPAREIMIMNDAIRNCVATGKTNQMKSVIQVSSAEGMVLMDKTLEDLARQGIITREMALSKCTDVEGMLQKLEDLA